MSTLVQDVRKIIESIKVYEPVYKVELSAYGNGENIRFTSNRSITSDIEHPLKKRIMRGVSTIPHFHEGEIELVYDINHICSNIERSIYEYVTSLILKGKKVTNSRLTPIYKWYSHIYCNFDKLVKSPEWPRFSEVMYNTYLHLIDKGSSSNEQITNSMHLLEYIRIKFECHFPLPSQ